MFMMQQLHRLDIWPVGDLGVRRGWQNMFGLQEKIEADGLKPLGDTFRPYRSIVAWYCWRAA
jgi:DNA-3-methyladenine glycosylase II